MEGGLRLDRYISLREEGGGVVDLVYFVYWKTSWYWYCIVLVLVLMIVPI